ncbi:alpha/beta hydrolase family protein [Paenibacillus glucanolyticus]|uniref:Peptidase S9 n=1 Tax=Paenibacillus glucanolyticus TaxID=59843 RepID=A0A163E321_9BACL|nr:MULTISPECIES: prolyl oligopeptidase family serine peptidase [Paenibacillus]AWP27076.1 peptidase S9 [Paenibacillus sp. Cedars]KZS43572.1 peptidase S9 [Paenibacillus glucanolyticus]MDH6670464.1 dipeptidyl aminopeptidase/acylaminoacyl peptidase [Paenibacillus sp. LBL]MPY18276.1 S9 family peptidase [Paenibacillus glucanolyticus]
MIYHIDYVSEGLHVKGYLGLPPQLPRTLSHKMAEAVDTMHGVTVTGTLACSILNREPASFEESSNESPKLPLVIYCRGGIGRIGAVRLKWVEEFSAQGYAVFAPAYRGNEGSEGRDEFGGADTMDVISAIDWLSRISWIDSSRIHVLGFSRGAINAAVAAAASPHISRMILWSGVSDLTQTYEERIDLRRMMKRVIGGSPAKVPEQYLLRSPLHYADRIPCPVLLVHGTQDEQVLVQHSYRMLDKLRECGHEPQTHLYEGLGHHFPPPQHAAAIHRMFDWLKKGD